MSDTVPGRMLPLPSGIMVYLLTSLHLRPSR